MWVKEGVRERLTQGIAAGLHSGWMSLSEVSVAWASKSLAINSLAWAKPTVHAVETPTPLAGMCFTSRRLPTTTTTTCVHHRQQQGRLD